MSPRIGSGDSHGLTGSERTRQGQDKAGTGQGRDRTRQGQDKGVGKKGDRERGEGGTDRDRDRRLGGGGGYKWTCRKRDSRAHILMFRCV